MRTTLSIDDDVLLAAKQRARREGRSIGAVLSDLARNALTGHGPTGGGGTLGFVPLPADGRVVTNELIDQLREEEGI